MSVYVTHARLRSSSGLRRLPTDWFARLFPVPRCEAKGCPNGSHPRHNCMGFDCARSRGGETPACGGLHSHGSDRRTPQSRSCWNQRQLLPGFRRLHSASVACRRSRAHSLTKSCAIVLNLVREVEKEDVEATGGYVPDAILVELVERLKKRGVALR